MTETSKRQSLRLLPHSPGHLLPPDSSQAFLFHVTTEKKAKKYREGGRILPPVRGFNTAPAAMAWAMKTGRKVILRIPVESFSADLHKLPDHHNQYGDAWWLDQVVTEWECEYSAGKDWQEAEIDFEDQEEKGEWR